MAEYVVVVLSQGADRVGGPVQPAVVPAVGTSAAVQLLSGPAMAALAKVLAEWQPRQAAVAYPNAAGSTEQLWLFILTFLPVAAAPIAAATSALPSQMPAVATPTPPASAVADSDCAPLEASLAPPAPPRARMPGWLAAHTRRQAAIVGRNARPTQAARGGPRGVNRPARRSSAPKPAARRPVVWMAAR